MLNNHSTGSTKEQKLALVEERLKVVQAEVLEKTKGIDALDARTKALTVEIADKEARAASLTIEISKKSKDSEKLDATLESSQKAILEIQENSKRISTAQEKSEQAIAVRIQELDERERTLTLAEQHITSERDALDSDIAEVCSVRVAFKEAATLTDSWK